MKGTTIKLMEEDKLFRNVFNEKLIETMSKNIAIHYPDFKSSEFIEKSKSNLNSLSFKERNLQITNALIDFLPSKFETAGTIILAVISSNSIPYKGNWDSFYFMPFGTFVAVKGCKKQHLPLAFQLLEEITKRFTAEFAIRPFINKYPTESLAQLNNWKKNKNEHVRRLASEGSRPRLPWAEKIDAHILNPEPCFTVLKDLMTDEALYVRKSVANHLNDISKDNVELLLRFLNDYSKSKNPNTQWIIKQALRTLVKKGNPRALSLLGFSDCNGIQLSDFTLSSSSIKMGENIQFSFFLKNTSNEEKKLVVDYLVYHQKSNGQLLPKVFKLKNIDLAPNEKISLTKVHSFKPISTRKYYEGKHKIAIQVNGTELENKEFELSPS